MPQKNYGENFINTFAAKSRIKTFLEIYHRVRNCENLITLVRDAGYRYYCHVKIRTLGCCRCPIKIKFCADYAEPFFSIAVSSSDYEYEVSGHFVNVYLCQ